MGSDDNKPLRVFSMDPGKINTWWSTFVGKTYMESGSVLMPDDIMDYYSTEFLKVVRDLLVSQEVGPGVDVVLERFQYRPGFGANSIEHVNQLIAIVFMTAIQLGANCYIYQAADHKTAYSKHHPEKFPGKLIKKIGDKYGHWMPRAKRLEPCQHVMDSMTLGAYHVLKRNGVI